MRFGVSLDYNRIRLFMTSLIVSDFFVLRCSTNIFSILSGSESYTTAIVKCRAQIYEWLCRSTLWNRTLNRISESGYYVRLVSSLVLFPLLSVHVYTWPDPRTDEIEPSLDNRQTTNPQL